MKGTECWYREVDLAQKSRGLKRYACGNTRHVEFYNTCRMMRTGNERLPPWLPISE